MSTGILDIRDRWLQYVQLRLLLWRCLLEGPNLVPRSGRLALSWDKEGVTGVYNL